MAGAKRQPLTRERIAESALALLDELGPDGLGMRPIALRLGVRAPSLYHHVSGVDEVVGLVHDLVDREIDLSTLEDPDWRHGIEAFAHSYRDAFRAHPHLMPLVADKPVLTHTAMNVYEALARTLRRSGVPVARVAHYMGLIDNAVVGSVLNDFATGIGLPNGVRVEEFPEIHAVLRASQLTQVNEDAFAASIAFVIDDIAREISTRPRSAGGRRRP